jgi:hypothetical protein
MHEREVPTDASLVRRLLAGQFPESAEARTAVARLDSGAAGERSTGRGLPMDVGYLPWLDGENPTIEGSTDAPSLTSDAAGFVRG